MPSITTPPDLVLSMHRPLAECITKSTEQAGPIITALSVQSQRSVLVQDPQKSDLGVGFHQLSLIDRTEWSRPLPERYLPLRAYGNWYAFARRGICQNGAYFMQNPGTHQSYAAQPSRIRRPHTILIAIAPFLVTSIAPPRAISRRLEPTNVAGQIMGKRRMSMFQEYSIADRRTLYWCFRTFHQST